MMQQQNELTLVDFQNDIGIDQWRVVDDVVMGGRSSGTFQVNNDGFGIFEGSVSLENNGGFSSVRAVFDRTDVSEYSNIILTIRGDGKPYQFRLKPQRDDQHSYIHTIGTTGEWEVIELNLADFYPGYRGRQLSIPNYSPSYLEEIRFLIGNKKAEDFRLEIRKIELK